MPPVEEAVGPELGNVSEMPAHRTRPYFDLCDEGATIYLSAVLPSGEDQVLMKRPRAGQWIDARTASNSDEESEARLISMVTPLSYKVVRDLYLSDFATLKEALAALAGF